MAATDSSTDQLGEPTIGRYNAADGRRGGAEAQETERNAKLYRCGHGSVLQCGAYFFSRSPMSAARPISGVAAAVAEYCGMGDAATWRGGDAKPLCSGDTEQRSTVTIEVLWRGLSASWRQRGNGDADITPKALKQPTASIDGGSFGPRQRPTWQHQRQHQAHQRQTLRLISAWSLGSLLRTQQSLAKNPA